MERYIGKMLDNRYEILEVIGTGGMAVVFKAKDHRLNRLVAVKMLKKDLSEDAEFRRRFHDESQAVAMLSHPNIMAVYDVSRGGGMDYIVMELIDGITLKQYMERRGRLNWPEAQHFITQIMKGLSHAHSRGIVHRDIKPQNIMVLRDGTVKVTDFGIACFSNGRNPSNEAIGSVHYISPEQAKGDYTDNRSDIYSAGVVFYEMLTSRLPFEGSDPVAVAIQRFNTVPRKPRELNPDIPEALEQICEKAMAPDRSRRYTTADEMLADLDAFRKDPNISFDYTAEDLMPEAGMEDEPTHKIPNVAVTRKQVQQAQAQSAARQAADDDDEDDDDEYERPRRFGWLKTLILIVLVAAAGYYGVTRLYEGVMGSFSTPEIPQYTVPDLKGYTVEEAREMEEVKGVFEIVEDAVYEYSNEYASGQIIRQDPEAGRQKKAASGELISINVTVSMGARSGGMLDLVGKEGRSARLLLEQDKDLSALHLDIQEGESEYSDEVEVGCVVRTEPAAGTPLAEGDTVTLYLSLGPKIRYATMVPCVGSTVEQVQALMDGLNLVAEFTKVESSQPEGQVLTQSVEAGTSIEEGSTVTFTYSDGEKLLPGTVGFTVPMSQDPLEEEVYVEIYIGDTSVFGSYMKGGEYLEQTFYQKAGTYSMKVYVDGLLFTDQEMTFRE